MYLDTLRSQFFMKKKVVLYICCINILNLYYYRFSIKKKKKRIITCNGVPKYFTRIPIIIAHVKLDFYYIFFTFKLCGLQSYSSVPIHGGVNHVTCFA